MLPNDFIVTVERTNDLLGLIQLQAKVKAGFPVYPDFTFNGEGYRVIPVGMAQVLYGMFPESNRKELEQEWISLAIAKLNSI